MELSKKLQVPGGTSLFLVGAPEGFDPGVQTSKETGAAVLAFVVSSGTIQVEAGPAVDAAREDRLSWIAYPKAGRLGTDLNRDSLAKALKPHGIEPVRIVSIDETWSAMRFRPVRS